MDPVIPVSKGGSRPRYSAGLWWNSRGLKTQDLKAVFGKPAALYLRGGLSRDISLWGRKTPFSWWIKWPSLQKTWQEDTIWAEDTLERAYTLVAFVFLGATWTALELGSVILSSLHSLGFFVLFSSDSSCHNTLGVMLQCKPLVEAEPFDFEPSGGLALRPIHDNK